MSLSAKAPSAPNGFDAPTLSEKEFELFRTLIRDETGISLAPVKRDLVRTRLRKRLRHLGISSYQEYYDHVVELGANATEKRELINCITTNKTDFFRESHHFTFLAKQAFPEITAAAEAKGKRSLRIWSAACSTGQEPYSIAVSAKEYFQNRAGWDIRILASDIDSNCLQSAAAGVYDEGRIEDIPLDVKKKYFLRGTGNSQGKVSVRRELQDLITFRRINFADANWPIHTKFDVIFCRNAMIYFERDFQEQLIRRFLRYLSPQGYLILGHSENVTWMKELEPLGQTIYRPRGTFATSTQDAAAGGTERPMATQPPRPVPQANARTSILSNPPRPPQRPVTPKPSATGTQLQNSHAPQTNTPSRAMRTAAAKKSIVAGEVYASNQDIEISTLLGSCIAACLYDPKVKAGGMNHFLLPQGKGDNADTACYGIHAMELLINELMILGAERSNLVAKLYGGARILGDQLQTSRVGEKNTEFVRKYLTAEGIPIVEQQVCGDRALRVCMTAHTGEVVARELEPAATREISQIDKQVVTKANDDVHQEVEEQITFF